MKYTRWILLIVSAMLLTACGGTSKKTDFFGEDPEPKKVKVDNSTSIKRNWKRNLGKNIETGDSILSPVLFGTSLYAASPKGHVYKVSASDGKIEWEAKLKKELISAGVGVGSGLVLVGTDQGKVIALSQTDGSVSWESTLDSEILASPVVDGNVVVARSGDGKVYGLSTYDGSRKWTISRQLPKLTLRGESRPIITQGVVFTGFSDGNLAAFAAETGRALWDFPITFARGTNDIDRLSDVDTDPLLVGDFLYISSYQEITHALDIKNQRIAWSAGISSFHSLAYDAAFLYITDKKGLVHQLDRSNGQEQWVQGALQYYSVSAPVSVGPYVLVSEGDGKLYVLRKTDGKLVGKHGFGANTIIGEPVVDADTVYFLDNEGSLQSISIVNKR